MHLPWVDVHRSEPGPEHREVIGDSAEVETWGGNSHCVHLEQPERFAALLTSARPQEHASPEHVAIRPGLTHAATT